VLALYDVANRHPDLRLGEVVLVAPDMDFGIFQRILPRISQLAASMTVYVAEDDRPLALSASLHGYPRLGQAGNDVATLSGVEVIDVSDLPAATPTGHIYHIYSEVVGEDLAQLLNEGRRAAQRRGMVQQDVNLWRLQPSTEVPPDPASVHAAARVHPAGWLRRAGASTQDR
jgi:esterase/lipase superfamily enzyme